MIENILSKTGEAWGLCDTCIAEKKKPIRIPKSAKKEKRHKKNRVKSRDWGLGCDRIPSLSDQKCGSAGTGKPGWRVSRQCKVERRGGVERPKKAY